MGTAQREQHPGLAPAAYLLNKGWGAAALALGQCPAPGRDLSGARVFTGQG